MLDRRILKRSGLVDEIWYLNRYPDVREASLDPLDHFSAFGATQACDPNPLFRTEWYVSRNPEVAEAGLNPLVHYLTIGATDGRDPHPLFDTDWYLAQNPEVAEAGLNPLTHYLKRGAKEGRDPSPSFDSDLYRRKYPDVAEAGANPLVHYLTENTSGSIPGPLQLPPCRDLSIIVPVFNAAKELERCLKSLLRYSDRDICKIVINDASTDSEVLAVIERFREAPNFSFHENERNQGFTKTVNRGIELAGRSDIIVLNADTEVTPGWIRGLRVAAYTSERVATATPLSNRASHFSVPRIGDNSIPYWMSIDSYARSIAHCSDLLLPRTPTAHGFCMFIKRDFIDEVGALDSNAFPVGYGEEADLSMRGIRRGWHHVVADNVFVFHVNAASFGASKYERLKGARRVLDQRYPEYGLLIREFRNSDTMKKIRAGSLRAWNPMGNALPRILFVISTGAAEAAQPREGLMRGLAGSFNLFLLMCDSRTIRLFKISDCKKTLLESNVLEHPVSPTTHRSEDYDRIAFSWLVRYAIEVVHIHHIARHSLNLPTISKQVGIPVVFSFRDFYAVCPTTDLLDENGIFCGGICAETKAQSSSQGEREMADAHSAIYDSLIQRDASSMPDACASEAKRPRSPATNKLCVGLILSTNNRGLQAFAHTRLLAPLSHPRLQGTVSIRLLDERSITRLSECDVVVVQHTAIGDAESATSLCNELDHNSVPMLLDIDGGLSAVPNEHPEHSLYAPRSRALGVLLDRATEVWTSTEALAAALKLPIGRYRVIETCLDRRIWVGPPMASVREPQTDLCRFLYLGSRSHDKDLGLVLEALDRLQDQKIGAFQLTVIGAIGKISERPWLQAITPSGEEVPYPVFVSWMLRQGPFDVGLAPLVDTPSNRLLSDVKLLEYAAMTVTPLASDVPPYKGEMLQRGLYDVVGERVDDWVNALGAVVSDPAGYRERALAIQEYLWAERESGFAAAKMEDALIRLSSFAGAYHAEARP